MQHIHLMSTFNAWANQIIYNVCAELHDDEYRMDRKSFFSSIHHTLNHLLLVDRLWICRLLGYENKEISSLDQILFENFDELRHARIKEDDRLLELVNSWDESDLNRSVSYARMNGVKGTNTVNEVMLTLFNHQTHHRGQIHTMLTQCDKQIPDMDVVDYLATA